MTFNPQNAHKRRSTSLEGRTPCLFLFKVILTLFFIFMYINFHEVVFSAQAQNQTSYDVYNLTALPERVADHMVLDLFSAQMLCSGVMLLLWVMPTAIITRSKKASWIPELALVVIVVGFEVAVGWLNVFFIVVLCFIIALLFAGKSRDFITGR